MSTPQTDWFIDIFEKNIPTYRKEIIDRLKENPSDLGFRSVWESFEDIIIGFLSESFKASPYNLSRDSLIPATSKSVYPDLKVAIGDKLFAFDVKSGEASKDPWYDMSRLDTYIKTHIYKYVAEYSIVVKWSGRGTANRSVDAIYIEPAHHTVGLHNASQGVKFRPYDGKIRPKSWADFESGKVYWPTKESFLKGLMNSAHYRQQELMRSWYKEFTEAQKKALRSILDRIDAQDNS